MHYFLQQSDEKKFQKHNQLKLRCLGKKTTNLISCLRRLFINLFTGIYRFACHGKIQFLSTVYNAIGAYLYLQTNHFMLQMTKK
jgi:hypothetical protein